MQVFFHVLPIPEIRVHIEQLLIPDLPDQLCISSFRVGIQPIHHVREFNHPGLVNVRPLMGIIGK